MKKRIISAIAACLILASSLSVYADAVPTVTIGADLTAEQKQKIYNFFGVSSEVVQEISITNEQERQALTGLVSDDIIGTRTLSCAYILPTNSGGLVVKTANLNWVTEGMIANALLTSGVENCQVLATAPFEVSGTGALTGVLLAYEKATGETLEEDKKELANSELILTAELADTVETPEEVKASTYVMQMLSDMKSEAVNGNLNEEKAKEIIDKYTKQYGIDLTDEYYEKLSNYLIEFSNKEYSKSFKESITSLKERVTSGFTINTDAVVKESKNFFAKIWSAIKNFFANLFGNKEEEEEIPNIFQNVDTDVISFDTDREEDLTEEESSLIDEESSTTEEESSLTKEESSVEESSADEESLTDESSLTE